MTLLSDIIIVKISVFKILLNRNKKSMTQYLTKDGLEKLEKELVELKTFRRPQIIERIQKAKELGDLSENAEYQDAKDEQSFIEGRIVELENLINKAEIINNQLNGGQVNLGGTVIVECDGETKKYTIVGSREADPVQGIISNESPLGRAFLGRKIGETVEVEVPRGLMRCKIVEVA